eukprot:103320_1
MAGTIYANNKLLGEFNTIVKPILGTRSRTLHHSIPMFSSVYESMYNIIEIFINPSEVNLKIRNGHHIYENVFILIGKYVLQLLSIESMVKVRNKVGQYTKLKANELVKLEELLRANNCTTDAIEEFLRWRVISPMKENIRKLGTINNEIRYILRCITQGKRYSQKKADTIAKFEIPNVLIKVKIITKMFIIQQIMGGYDPKKCKMFWQIEFDKISIRNTLNDDESEDESEEESDDEDEDDAYDEDSDVCDNENDDAELVFNLYEHKNLCRLTYVKGSDLLELNFENDDDEKKVITPEIRDSILFFQADVIRPKPAMFQSNITAAQSDGTAYKSIQRWFDDNLATYKELRNKMIQERTRASLYESDESGEESSSD